MTRAFALGRLPRRGFLGRALGAVAGLLALPNGGRASGAVVYEAGDFNWETGIGLIGEQGPALVDFGRPVPLGPCAVFSSGPTPPTWPSEMLDGSTWTDTSVTPPVKRYLRGGRWVTDREIATETGAPGHDDPHDDCGGRWA